MKARQREHLRLRFRKAVTMARRALQCERLESRHMMHAMPLGSETDESNRLQQEVPSLVQQLSSQELASEALTTGSVVTPPSAETVEEQTPTIGEATIGDATDSDDPAPSENTPIEIAGDGLSADESKTSGPVPQDEPARAVDESTSAGDSSDADAPDDVDAPGEVDGARDSDESDNVDEPSAVDGAGAAEQPPSTEAPTDADPSSDVVAPAAGNATDPVESPQAEQPAEVDAPSHVDIPTPVEVPAEVEEPAQAEEPKNVEAPADVEEPADIEAPAPVDQPPAVEEPSDTETPPQAEMPSDVDESQPEHVDAELPGNVETPADVEEPAEVEAPADVDKPTDVEAPGRVDESTNVDQPKAVEDTANGDEAEDADVSETRGPRPVDGSQSTGDKKPDNDSVPVAVPVKADGPFSADDQPNLNDSGSVADKAPSLPVGSATGPAPLGEGRYLTGNDSDDAGDGPKPEGEGQPAPSIESFPSRGVTGSINRGHTSSDSNDVTIPPRASAPLGDVDGSPNAGRLVTSTDSKADSGASLDRPVHSSLPGSAIANTLSLSGDDGADSNVSGASSAKVISNPRSISLSLNPDVQTHSSLSSAGLSASLQAENLPTRGVAAQNASASPWLSASTALGNSATNTHWQFSTDAHVIDRMRSSDSEDDSDYHAIRFATSTADDVAIEGEGTAEADTNAALYALRAAIERISRHRQVRRAAAIAHQEAPRQFRGMSLQAYLRVRQGSDGLVELAVEQSPLSDDYAVQQGLEPNDAAADRGWGGADTGLYREFDIATLNDASSHPLARETVVPTREFAVSADDQEIVDAVDAVHGEEESADGLASTVHEAALPVGLLAISGLLALSQHRFGRKRAPLD